MHAMFFPFHFDCIMLILLIYVNFCCARETNEFSTPKTILGNLMNAYYAMKFHFVVASIIDQITIQ